MNTAILYSSEGYSLNSDTLMGVNVASADFLRAFASYSSSTEFWACIHKSEYAEPFTAAIRAAKRQEPVYFVQRHNLSDLARPGLLFVSGPTLSRLAWLRAAHGHTAFSLCGITHATSGYAAAQLAALLTSPLQPWDSLICTSRAVKDNVQRLLRAQGEYLRERLGAQRFVLPELPLIPLGIHTADFINLQKEKAKARAELGLGDDELLVLYMGRLTFCNKASPLPMYEALEMAAAETGRKLVLLECGWFASPEMQQAYTKARQALCPSVRYLHLDGRQNENCRLAWACADIFCSLADNVQESFGLTPLEAMAVGLPVVVSDWSGYRDTVRHNIDGFCVPTVMPHAGLGNDLAQRFALEMDSYENYSARTASLVAVDVRAARDAFVRLIKDPALRSQMGTAGKTRACSIYDWSNILPQMEEHWAQQQALRLAQAEKAAPHPWPAHIDPFYAFAAYPTRTLTATTRLCLSWPDLDAATKQVDRLLQLDMVNSVFNTLITRAELQAVLQNCAKGPLTASSIVADLPKERQAHAFRALTWLLKLNILQLTK